MIFWIWSTLFTHPRYSGLLCTLWQTTCRARRLGMLQVPSNAGQLFCLNAIADAHFSCHLDFFDPSVGFPPRPLMPNKPVAMFCTFQKSHSKFSEIYIDILSIWDFQWTFLYQLDWYLFSQTANLKYNFHNILEKNLCF